MNLTVTCGGIPPSQVLRTIETSGWQHFPGYSEEVIDLILRNRHLNWDDPVTVHNYIRNMYGPFGGSSSSSSTYPSVIGINSSFVFPAYDPKLVEEYINRQVSFVEPSEPAESSWEDLSLPKDIFITVTPIDGVIEWRLYDRWSTSGSSYDYPVRLFFSNDCVVKVTFHPPPGLRYDSYNVNMVQAYYFITDYVLLPKFIYYNGFLEQSKKQGFEVFFKDHKKVKVTTYIV